MQQVLEQDYKLAANWQEKYSRNTFENALESVELLRAASIEHVILVTHGYHMRRAIWSFEQMGIKVTAAPTGFTTLGYRGRTVHAYLPSAHNQPHHRHPRDSSRLVNGSGSGMTAG
jgi:uncharacterized SAM-binding protein YcdF (DUF218 family)